MTAMLGRSKQSSRPALRSNANADESPKLSTTNTTNTNNTTAAVTSPPSSPPPSDPKSSPNHSLRRTKRPRAATTIPAPTSLDLESHAQKKVKIEDGHHHNGHGDGDGDGDGNGATAAKKRNNSANDDAPVGASVAGNNNELLMVNNTHSVTRRSNAVLSGSGGDGGDINATCTGDAGYLETITTTRLTTRKRGAAAAATAAASNNISDVGAGGDSSAVKSTEKRSLRSHGGGSRAKSELAMYFSNFDQLMSLEPVEEDYLTADSIVTLIDDLPPNTSITTSPILSPKKAHPKNLNAITNGVGVTRPVKSNTITLRPPAPSVLNNLHNATRIDLTALDNVPISSRRHASDPLSDDLYFKAHRRAERAEKHIRNIEKERAQHEKLQLERLLGELRGPDWLRCLGVTGVTESEKQLYQGKRALFIAEVKALIEKFRVWKEEEKRRKEEKLERELEEDETSSEEEEEVTESEAAEDESDDPQGAEEEEKGIKSQPTKKRRKSKPKSKPRSKAREAASPDPSDVDAWAARQLHQEAKASSATNSQPKHRSGQQKITAWISSASANNANTKSSRKKEAGAQQHLPSSLPLLPPRRPPKPSNADLRNLSPDPEFAPQQFSLPESLLTADAIRASARRRRAAKRERANAGNEKDGKKVLKRDVHP